MPNVENGEQSSQVSEADQAAADVENKQKEDEVVKILKANQEAADLVQEKVREEQERIMKGEIFLDNYKRNDRYCIWVIFT